MNTLQYETVSKLELTSRGNVEAAMEGDGEGVLGGVEVENGGEEPHEVAEGDAADRDLRRHERPQGREEGSDPSLLLRRRSRASESD